MCLKDKRNQERIGISLVTPVPLSPEGSLFIDALLRPYIFSFSTSPAMQFQLKVFAQNRIVDTPPRLALIRRIEIICHVDESGARQRGLNEAW